MLFCGDKGRNGCGRGLTFNSWQSFILKYLYCLSQTLRHNSQAGALTDAPIAMLTSLRVIIPLAQDNAWHTATGTFPLSLYPDTLSTLAACQWPFSGIAQSYSEQICRVNVEPGDKHTARPDKGELPSTFFCRGSGFSPQRLHQEAHNCL